MRRIAILRRPQQLVALTDRGVVPVTKMPELLESWKFLAQARCADAETLRHLQRVLDETVPDLTAELFGAKLPASWGASLAQAPRATRAHPRAFKGTKYQPPKAAGLETVDLRPFLCDAHSLQAVLKPFGLRASSKHPWNLPPRFVQYLWPVLRENSRELAGQLALFQELDLDDRLLAKYSLLVEHSSSAALAWGRAAAALPEDRGRTLLRELRAETPLAQIPNVAELNRIASDDAQFAAWLARLLAALTEAAPYWLAGFRLAAAYRPEERFADHKGHCQNYPAELIEDIALRFNGGPAMSLWELCGEFPDFANWFRTSRCRELGAEGLESYLWTICGALGYWESGSVRRRRWNVLSKLLPAIEAALLGLPESHHSRAIRGLDALIWAWDDALHMQYVLTRGLPLLLRVSRPPFPANSTRAVFALAELSDIEPILAAPDSSFDALFKACRRDQDSLLIYQGLGTLCQHMEALSVAGFRQAPKRLLKAAQSLGCMSRPVRVEVLRRCMELPLWTLDAAQTPLRELCAAITASRGPAMTNPIPARLQAWLDGSTTLSEASLARHREVVLEKLLYLRFDLIDQAVEQRLCEGFSESADDLHAMRLLAFIDRNRRGLRKFLKAYWSGDRDYIAKHPETTAWYRKHRALPRKLWEQGLDFETADGIRIAVEQDPLEVLKLGTYVGSCLAIGGICTYSAAAAVLDANKRVLYARDQRGRVIARQLLAVDRYDKLVCFPVYPASASRAIQEAFRQYDLAFAAALGIPLLGPDEDSEIGCILSESYYQDDQMDLASEEKS